MTSNRPETERIDITGAKRQMVYAKYIGESNNNNNNNNNNLLILNDWLILVDMVDIGKSDTDTFVYRHASYSLGHNNIFYISETSQRWGSINNYQFYKLTDEEKKFFTKMLTEHGYKYIRVLNKLVPR